MSQNKEDKQSLREELWESWKKEGDYYEDFSNDTRPMTAENLPRIGRKYIRAEGVLIPFDRIADFFFSKFSSRLQGIRSKIQDMNDEKEFEGGITSMGFVTKRDVLQILNEEKK